MIIEQGTNYAYIVDHIEDFDFNKIMNLAQDFVKSLPNSLQDELTNTISNNVNIITSEPQMQMYINCFGLIHQARLKHAYNRLSKDILSSPEIELIDYGCGQGLGSIVYGDFLRSNNISQCVKRITLIEPSKISLQRSALHVKASFPNATIRTINKGFDDLKNDDFEVDKSLPTLHILSNVLDIDGFNVHGFGNTINDKSLGYNQFVIAGPFFKTDIQENIINQFVQIFNINNVLKATYEQGQFISGKEWTCSIRLFETGKINKVSLDSFLINSSYIAKAIELAFNARKIVDAFYDCKEISFYEDPHNRALLAEEIKKDLQDKDWVFQIQSYFNFPKNNKGDFRHVYYIPLKDYALRFIFGFIRYSNIEKENYGNFFGGLSNVFIIQNSTSYYKPYLTDFLNWQEESSGKYDFLLSLDIKSFFDSINPHTLLKEYLSENFSFSNYYKQLFLSMLSPLKDNKYKPDVDINPSGLNCASYVDDYFANIVLQSIDKKLGNVNWISYGRLTDDIRIFFNGSENAETITNMVEDCLLNIGLTLNQAKTKLTSTKIEKLELEKHFFTKTSVIVFLNSKTKTKTELLPDTIEEIVEQDYATDYLLSVLDSHKPEILPHYGNWVKRVDSIKYIIRNVFRTQRYFDFATLTFLRFGQTYCYDGNSVSGAISVFSKCIEMLNDEELNSYTKYWILRNFFLTNDMFYKDFFNADNYVNDNNDSYFIDLYNIIKKLSISPIYILNSIANYIIINKHIYFIEDYERRITKRTF